MNTKDKRASAVNRPLFDEVYPVSDGKQFDALDRQHLVGAYRLLIEELVAGSSPWAVAASYYVPGGDKGCCYAPGGSKGFYYSPGAEAAM